MTCKITASLTPQVRISRTSSRRDGSHSQLRWGQNLEIQVPSIEDYGLLGILGIACVFEEPW